MRVSILRCIAAVALVCVAIPSLSDAQAGFHRVAPTGSYLTASPADWTVNPLMIDLSGLGRTINLMPSGILRVAGFNSPDHDAAFCSVFARTTDLLPQLSANRVTTAIGPVAAPACVSRQTFYYGIPTDITQDFFIAPMGLTVTAPNGANYLMIAVEDDQYADNVTLDASKYGITVTSVVPEPSTYALLAFGMLTIAGITRRKRFSR